MLACKYRREDREMADRKYPRHVFWGAGEPDCPEDLKASNGELIDMRCKVCGDGWRESHDVCMTALKTGPDAERMDRAETSRWKTCARCTTPDYCTNQLRGCDISELLEAGIAPLAPDVRGTPVAKPSAWLDSFGEPHRRREDAWDGKPGSAEPSPLYEHPPSGVKVRHFDLEPPAEFFYNGERYQRKNNGQSVKLSDGSWWYFDAELEVTPADGVGVSNADKQ